MLYEEYLPLVLLVLMVIYKIANELLNIGINKNTKIKKYSNSLLILCVVLVSSKILSIDFVELGFRLTSIGSMLKSLVWGILAGASLFFIMLVIVSFVPSQKEEKAINHQVNKKDLIVGSWFLNAFSEELFYRGLFITLLIPLAQYQMNLLGLSFSIAVVFPAILYTLNNLSLSKRISNPYIASKVISSFVLALVSGSLFLKTNSIIPCYLLHVSYLVTGTGISILFNKATKRLVSKMKEQKIDDDRKRQLGELYPIELFENKDCYLDRFNKEKDYILNLLGEFAPLKVEHIGSTAIRSIKTKPTVDMIIELKEGMTENVLKEILEPLGYIFMIEQTKHIMFVKGYLETGLAEESYHLHFACLDNSYIWDRVYFRDYLNEFTEVAIEYEELKLGLEKLNKWDREGYTDGKAKFVKRITEKAKDYYSAIS